jgi:hypothetical protein
VAIPIASLPVAAFVVAAIVVSPLVVTAIVVAIVATLVTITVAIVGLRGGNDATDERERQGSSSNQTFHFRSPATHRTNRLGTHYRPGRLIGD